MFPLFPFASPRRVFSLSPTLLTGFFCCVLLFTACGGSVSSQVLYTHATTSSVSVPSIPTADLVTPGTLTIGSDTTYMPQEFVDSTTRQTVGFDIDLITAMAQRLGLKRQIVSSDFSTLLSGLQEHEFDVAISAIGITPEREQMADFIPYLRSGELLLVRKGNPLHIQALTDLCGQSAAVVEGTVEQADLHIASTTCVAAHKPAIHLVVLSDQNAVIQLLLTGQVTATYQDAPVSDYFLKLYPQQLAPCGSIVNWDTEGIAVRKGDVPMKRALQHAFQALEADGTYQHLLAKWGLINESIIP